MELERRFNIGAIHEALNPPQITAFAARRGLSTPEAALKEAVRERLSASGWFGFKAGARAMALGEHLGLLDQYWTRTTFILLLRRDVVAQAVSIARAKLSGQNGLALGKWRALSVKEEVSDARPEDALHPRVS